MWVGRLRHLARGVEVVAVSAVSGAGLAMLDAAITVGATLAVVGPSGAGKSTLVNALAGREARFQATRSDARLAAEERARWKRITREHRLHRPRP